VKKIKRFQASTDARGHHFQHFLSAQRLSEQTAKSATSADVITVRSDHDTAGSCKRFNLKVKRLLVHVTHGESHSISVYPLHLAAAIIAKLSVFSLGRKQ
jgi:hypothetical protein